MIYQSAFIRENLWLIIFLLLPEMVCQMTRFDRKRHHVGDKFRRFA